MKAMFPLGEHTVLIDYDVANLGEHLDLVDIIDRRKQITDETGVPLESDRYDPPADLDFEYTACPYADSPTRYPDGQPSPTPMSGLEKRRLSESYGQVRRELLATRSAYFDLMGFDQDRALTIGEGIGILSTMQYLPSYLTDRVSQPVAIQKALPQHLITGSNCASGAIGAIGAFSQGVDGLNIPTGEVLLAAVESAPDSPLIGRDTVCAASPRMIKQFLDLLKDGSDTIEFGTVEDETNGLLTSKEVANALVLGIGLESTQYYNGVAANADQTASTVLERFNPKKHNPRRVQSAIKDFMQDTETFIGGYEAISARANASLGRVAIRDNEFSDFYTKNPFRFKTIALAKAKGIKLS